MLEYPTVSRKPGVWDRIVGVSHRAPLGSHWLLTLHGDGGGFGVGFEVDLATNLTLDWRATRPRLALGYGLLYFRVRDSLLEGTTVDDTLELGTTLHGPILGFEAPVLGLAVLSLARHAKALPVLLEGVAPVVVVAKSRWMPLSTRVR